MGTLADVTRRFWGASFLLRQGRHRPSSREMGRHVLTSIIRHEDQTTRVYGRAMRLLVEYETGMEVRDDEAAHEG